MGKGAFLNSPAGVHHHYELVPLGAVSNCQLDLSQGELAGCRPTVNRAERDCHSQTAAEFKQAGSGGYRRTNWMGLNIHSDTYSRKFLQEAGKCIKRRSIITELEVMTMELQYIILKV